MGTGVHTPHSHAQPALPVDDVLVCPRCGVAPRAEDAWCDGCGLRLARMDELPTAREFADAALEAAGAGAQVDDAGLAAAQVVGEFVQRVLVERDIAAIDQLMAESARCYVGSNPYFSFGREDRKADLAALLGASSDAQWRTERVDARGEYVLWRYAVSGTHDGDTLAQASGRPIAAAGVQLFTVVGGRITEVRLCTDVQSVTRRLALPTPLTLVCPGCGAGPGQETTCPGCNADLSGLEELPTSVRRTAHGHSHAAASKGFSIPELGRPALVAAAVGLAALAAVLLVASDADQRAVIGGVLLLLAGMLAARR